MPSQIRERTRLLETQMFGRHVHFSYSERWVGWTVFWLRMVMGWTMFWAGIDKLREGLHGFLQPDWSAAGYLQFAIAPENPFRDLFVDMAGSASVDFLVAWGLTLTGIGLLTGTLLRVSAFFSAVMMIFFYLAAWTGPWFRLEHGWVVDDHIVYAFLLFGLGAFGAGRILGVDAWLERTEFVKKNPWLSYLLG